MQKTSILIFQKVNYNNFYFNFSSIFNLQYFKIEFDFNNFSEERTTFYGNKQKMDTKVLEFHKEIEELKLKLKNI